MLEPRAVADAGAPVLRRRAGGDLGRLLAVVGVVGNEVLDDDLLQMPVLGVHRRERLERPEAILTRLADPDEDSAGERDAQLAGGPDRLQAQRGMLGRRTLMGDQVGVDGLQHQPLRGCDLPQPGQVRLGEHAQVGVGQQSARQGLLTHPDHVAGEVLEAQLVQSHPDTRVDLRLLAGQHEQLPDLV